MAMADGSTATQPPAAFFTKIEVKKKRERKMKKSFNQPRVSSPRGRISSRAGLFLIVVTVFLTIKGSTAHGQTYHVKDIGSPNGLKVSESAALNSLGQVAGTTTSGQFGYAFLYSNGTEKQEIEQLGSFGSRGFGIDPTGTVVGDAFFLVESGTVSHAAMFKDGTAVDLGSLGGQLFSRANGVNALRQVVGFSGPRRDTTESRGFIWTEQVGMVDIGTLGGSYARTNAINDEGFVTGTSQVDDVALPGGTHAFIYQPLSPTERHSEPMRDIGTLGGNSSYGMSINNNNHVVGYSTINNVDDRVHAFFYNGKTMIDLGSLRGEGFGDHSAALSVNNTDQVVGVNYVPTGDRNNLSQVAFIWNLDGHQNGKLVDLNTLIGPAAKTLWLLSAVGINDDGEIAATAYDYSIGAVRAVLLTPAK